jgi:acetylornithine deacetylase/succinyl-diaminopimelate desuccinylase-like protein
MAAVDEATQREQALNEFTRFLSIPSISSLPEHADDVRTAARWVADRLQTAGIEHVKVMETGGHPAVYGDWLHASGKPTVLIYGHFDVQPVDPLDLWETGPFSPEIRDGRIYARGASDMKGGLLTSILGVEQVLRDDGALPVNLKFIFEGEEEIGSPSLPAFVAQHREMLAADLVVNGDGVHFSEDRPALLLALRGGCGVQIDIKGTAFDVHSGLYGGAAPNAAQALAELLHSMHTPEGAVTVEGFYDDVVLLSDDDRRSLEESSPDEASLKAELGVRDLPGEPGYSAAERIAARPTLEINGMWGGFQGEGVKTVIPSEAHAKITCRLVANQDPTTIVETIERHVALHTPAGVTATVVPLPFRALPYLMPRDHWANQIAREVLTDSFGAEPYEMRLGGSVPVCETFLTVLGVYSVGFGWGLPDEHVHSPNEFMRLRMFHRAVDAWSALVRKLSSAQPSGH